MILTKNQKIKELQRKLKETEDNRHNMYIHFTEQLKKKNQELDEMRSGAMQLNSLVNAILIGVALDYDGKVTIPKDNLDRLNDYSLSVETDEENYYIEAILRAEIMRAEDDENEVQSD